MLSADEKKNIQNKIREVYFPPWKDTDPVLYALVEDFKVPVQVIADKVGTKRPNVSMWCRGKRPIPDHYKGILHDLLEEVVKAAKEALENMKKIHNMFPPEGKPGEFLDTKYTWMNQARYLEWKIERAETIIIFYTA